MKKFFVFLLAFVFGFAVFGVCASAQDAPEQTQAQGYIEQSGIEAYADALGSEAEQFLKDIGLEKLSAENIYHLDFSHILKAVLSLFRSSLKESGKQLLHLCAVVVIAAFADAFGAGLKSAKSEKIFSICAGLCIALLLFTPMSALIAQSGVAIEGASAFSIGAVPIACVILAAQGKSISAAIFSASALGISQMISTLFPSFFLPLNHILLGVGVGTALDNTFQSEKMIAVIRKYLLVILSGFSVLYFTVLSVRTNLSGAVDEGAMKSLKFASSAFVPVIGSAMSDSASAVIASLNVSKSAIGAFGIVCILAVFMPLLCKILLWLAGLEAIALLSSVFELQTVKKMLCNFSQALRVLLIIIIFCIVIFMMNFAAVVQMRGSV